MVDSITTGNLKLTKPEVGASATTWGTKLNADLDTIDAQVTANQNAVAANAAPIGSITMFAGSTAPTNWLLCDGTVYQNSSIPQLAPILNNQYNTGTAAVPGTSSAVPNLTQKFPLGSGLNPLGQTGGSLQASIAVGNLPSHSHQIIDVAHSHAINQNPHVHPDPGHQHTIIDAQHLHKMGGGYAAGAGTFTNVPVLNSATTDTYTEPSYSGINHTEIIGAGLQGANAILNLQPNGTGLSTTQPVGSGTPLNIAPPFCVVNYIIRYQ